MVFSFRYVQTCFNVPGVLVVAQFMVWHRVSPACLISGTKMTLQLVSVTRTKTRVNFILLVLFALTFVSRALDNLRTVMI